MSVHSSSSDSECRPPHRFSTNNELNDFAYKLGVHRQNCGDWYKMAADQKCGVSLSRIPDARPGRKSFEMEIDRVVKWLSGGVVTVDVDFVDRVVYFKSPVEECESSESDSENEAKSSFSTFDVLIYVAFAVGFRLRGVGVYDVAKSVELVAIPDTHESRKQLQAGIDHFLLRRCGGALTAEADFYDEVVYLKNEPKLVVADAPLVLTETPTSSVVRAASVAIADAQKRARTDA